MVLLHTSYIPMVMTPLGLLAVHVGTGWLDAPEEDVSENSIKY